MQNRKPKRAIEMGDPRVFGKDIYTVYTCIVMLL